MADYLYLAFVLAGMMYLLWSQRVRSDVAAVLVMLSLIVPWPHPDGEWSALLTYQQGFAGFGSSAVIMIAAMFVIAAAIVQTGAAEVLGMRLLRAAAGREWMLQLAVLLLATVTSMFINDTTVVLILLPLILSICKEFDLSPSRYLLFAAYGSLLGGQWTLIGTRSNIIVSDFLRQETGSGIGFFAFSSLGAPIFGLAALFLMLVGRKLLPSKAALRIQPPLTRFLTEIVVPEGSDYIGASVRDIEIFGSGGFSVVAVLRDGQRYPTGIDLRQGDLIVVRGTTDEIQSAVKSPDLEVREQGKLTPALLERADLVTAEVILPARSGFTGYSPRRLGLDRHYGLTVLGISHHGQPVEGGLMDTRLGIGDSLLVLGTSADVQRLEDDTTLIPLRPQAFPAIGKRKAWIIGTLLAGVIVASISGTLTPAIAMPLAAAGAVLLGCLTVRAAYEAIDWPTIVTLGAIIPFGLALQISGAAGDLAQLIVDLFSERGSIAVIGGLLLIAVILTQIIENAAVAIVVAPIALEIAAASNLDPAPVLVALGVCVSAGFSTPISHESTILVMGPGQYEFRHYLTIGSVLALITWVIATFGTAALIDG
jgi:di/tricarboxylate transporter